MPSKTTPEKRAHRYLQASMHAGLTGLPAEHREAYEQQMRGHERAYRRVREHALAGSDRDFDQPLTPGEREHQRHLRTNEGIQEADVQRIRQELRGKPTTTAATRKPAASPRRATPRRASGRTRAIAAAGTGAAGDALHAATSNSGSTTIYILGVALLLILFYLLITKKGPTILTGAVNSLVGAAGAFVRPVDPIHELEAALGAGPITASAGAGSGKPESQTTPGHLPKNAQAKLESIAKQEDWSIPAWEGVISDESGGNPFAVNKETGALGIGQINPEDAANPYVPRAGSTASEFPKYKGDAVEQVEAMAEYIKERYQTPTAALAHENDYGNY